MEDRPSVELQNVTKRFGDFTAVRSLNLSFRRAERMAAVRPADVVWAMSVPS